MDLPEIRTSDALHEFIRERCGVCVERGGGREGGTAPFDYIRHAFFEGVDPEHRERPPAPPDCIVWAGRGGGKTFLGALATALDLVFKPGIQVRILAGSLEQAARMHEHLRSIFEKRAFRGCVRGRITERRITLRNGSRAELLAQSQASVRGTRPQKLRCDEVELFDPDVWSAAQLTTRSARLGGRTVRGAIEALSTMHLPHGLMSRLVAESAGGLRRVFRWGVADVLERCGDEFSCGTCTLWVECGGRAKGRVSGHVPVRDALSLKGRVSLDVWRSEMMCQRPSRSDAVIREFSRERHVVGALPWEGGAAPGLWLGGMDFGFRSPTVFLWGAVDRGTLYIVDERHEANQTLEVHLRAILGAPYPRPAWIGADPAGGQRNEQTGSSSIAALRQRGLEVRAARGAVRDGLAAIRARLDPADGSPPRLLIHQRCVCLIDSLERYHYDPSRPYSEEPVKDGPDHAVDALRYLVVNLDCPFQSTGSRWA